MGFIKVPRVVLTSMPWCPINEPSLALASLNGFLTSKEIYCRSFQANIFLLKYIKASTYKNISELFSLNDFLFTYTFENNIDKNQDEELRKLTSDLFMFDWRWNTRFSTANDIFDFLLTIRNEVIPKYIEECAERILDMNPTMVGLTCTFDQTLSSLALSKVIKDKGDPLIVLGGYNVSGDKGRKLLKSFQSVDVVCSGDGESQIVQLAEASINRNKLYLVPNASYRTSFDLDTSRNNKILTSIVKVPILDLDNKPEPNFKDYFNDVDKLLIEDKVKINIESIPVENSRGCWWGQKNPCIFCGIEKENAKYRQLSEFTAYKNINSIVNDYNIRRIRFIDYIMPKEYYKRLLPELLPRIENLEIGMEIKSNINYKQAKILMAAGAKEVQPGIESFSTRSLERMNKGVTGIQNIACILYLNLVGIKVHYNLLFDFPGEQDDVYTNMMKIIPCLYHLDPPYHTQRVEITNDSTLLNEWEKFGYLTKPNPKKIYNLIFSKDYMQEKDFSNEVFAYYYEAEKETAYNADYYKVILQQVGHWHKIRSSRSVHLYWKKSDGKIVFIDTRYSESPEVTELDECYLTLIEFLDNNKTRKKRVFDCLSSLFSVSDIDNMLSVLESKRFLLIGDGFVLNLAFSNTHQN